MWSYFIDDFTVHIKTVTLEMLTCKVISLLCKTRAHVGGCHLGRWSLNVARTHCVFTLLNLQMEFG